MMLFYYGQGAFPLHLARFFDRLSHIALEVAIGGELHSFSLLDPRDVARFRDAVEQQAHDFISWHDNRGQLRGLPRAATYYTIHDQAGLPLTVTWHWVARRGSVLAEEAERFLMSAGHLRTCRACERLKLIPWGVEICDACGYYVPGGRGNGGTTPN